MPLDGISFSQIGPALSAKGIASDLKSSGFIGVVVSVDDVGGFEIKYPVSMNTKLLRHMAYYHIALRCILWERKRSMEAT